MKNIKSFKYWYSFEFEVLLKEHGYTIDDIKGFRISSIARCDGNVLKTYKVYVRDGKSIYFSIAYFKSFNECNQSRLGLKGGLLSSWYKTSIIKFFKLSGEYIYV